MNTNTQKGLKVKSNVKAGGCSLQHNQTVAVDEPNVVADLEAANAEEIKGGPKKIFIGGLSVAEQNNLTDLEPQDDVKGGFRDLLIFNGKAV